MPDRDAVPTYNAAVLTFFEAGMWNPEPRVLPSFSSGAKHAGQAARAICLAVPGGVCNTRVTSWSSQFLKTSKPHGESPDGVDTRLFVLSCLDFRAEVLPIGSCRHDTRGVAVQGSEGKSESRGPQAGAHH